MQEIFEFLKGFGGLPQRDLDNNYYKFKNTDFLPISSIFESFLTFFSFDELNSLGLLLTPQNPRPIPQESPICIVVFYKKSEKSDFRCRPISDS